MAWSIDARIPVTLVADEHALAAAAAAAPAAFVLRQVFGAPSHQPGCACCEGRSPAALALDRLFLDRVRGQVPFFGAVLAQEDAQLRTALTEDRVVAARFRLLG
ncbi:hypothetical protein C8P66_13137 [Humitalea rosea]|uniref:Uncharacterized protein n=1 Tax=Humitalea rosea TaxID=990373 RepID=A0A2W7HWZ4_9PROT|nr:hypothetical protein [Humitalea rosea]PZW39004.1 hypothetical protein C8P66_13137 [Humitalea rosea]